MTALQLLCAFKSMAVALTISLPLLGPNCTLCPANWQWIGGDTCFYMSREKRPWKQSREFCSLQNSTLLMLQDKEKDCYWIGLSCKSKGNNWHWEDGSAFSAQRTDW
uniref:C-type lectin domain-containing protein n=1 Tax=Chrysemys picta bellii TaxID=8478 RepID=A0A8C3HLB5_CHRPI